MTGVQTCALPISKNVNGWYSFTHIKSGLCVNVGGCSTIKEVLDKAEQYSSMASEHIRQHSDLIVESEVAFEYCISHGGSVNCEVSRHVEPERVIEILNYKQSEFLYNLYLSLQIGDALVIYQNPYVRKWIRIEQAFKAHGIKIRPDGFHNQLSCVRENLECINDYLELEYALPFN